MTGETHDVLEGLNEAQQKAVTHTNGPLLIIAGAGTGKTTVITRRIAWLLEDKKLKTENILALTFTEKAAAEMEERIDQLLPFGYMDLWVSTFHSFCERILKQHAIDIGLPPDFTILDQTNQALLVREHIDTFELEYYKPLGNPTKFIHALLSHFSRAKDEGIVPEEYLTYAEELQQNEDQQEFRKGDDIPEHMRIAEIANAYHTYQKLLLENSALDFGDLILYTLQLLKKRPAIANAFQKQFRYVLVDEFQDTNYAQYELVKLFLNDKKNITVVGDDDQCLPGSSQVQLETGAKRIDKIKIGDEVLTGVGKGHIGVSKVTKTFAHHKRARFISLTTESGEKITVTDNHKMFCYVPQKLIKFDFHYVYLMHRAGLGWRIGVTNDIVSRLRLERSADKIVGIGTYNSDQEARYWESLFSLKYCIPTVCFHARKGSVITGQWLQKLYAAVDSERGTKALARELGIDLDAPHFSLQGVVRGKKSRVKIYLEMNYRKYRSKDHVQKGKQIIHNPHICHQVSLETSDRNIVKKITNAGIAITKAKKGWRVRIQTSDIRVAGKYAHKLQLLTGGILENRCAIGRVKNQHLPALVMPASNVLKGHYLPVMKGNNIEYERVGDIRIQKKEQTVYDLEVEGTHNFIADNIVVHNSIYKFRGAAISNILEFKKDFADATEVVLTRNYRSKQNILDLAYGFIQQNNPNRLEVTLGKNKEGKTLSKKLISEREGPAALEHMHLTNHEQEARRVIETIADIKKKDGEATWSDFAILVRANDHANLFLSMLERNGIPYQFVAARGLFQQPVVLDVINYLKLLDNFHEQKATYRVLGFPYLNIPVTDIMLLNEESKKRNTPLFELLKNIRMVKGVQSATIPKVEKLVSLLEKHTYAAKKESVGQVTLRVLRETGYLAHITERKDPTSTQNTLYLTQFFKKIQAFEESHEEARVADFLKEIALAQDVGDTGAIGESWESGPDTVKVMTVHGAKGLEFRYVFLVSLVDKRFPSIERKEQIELPLALVKETLTKGDVHLEEERRLFYVALTRAKDGLFLTSAEDYGGLRAKKPSRFLTELGFEPKTEKLEKSMLEIEEAQMPETDEMKLLRSRIPKKFSFTQFQAFESCPKQYKYAHILQIPAEGRFTFSYGKTMHACLQRLYEHVQEKASGGEQSGLFDEKQDTDKAVEVSFDKIKRIYEEEWINEWYVSKKHEEEYFEKGKEELRAFHALHGGKFHPALYLEKGFTLKVGSTSVKGQIDRVDRVAGGVRIVDYKTGSAPDPKKKLDKEKLWQLYLYARAARDVLKEKPVTLSFYYFDLGGYIDIEWNEKDEQKIMEKTEGTIEGILKSNFIPTPSKFTCKYCDFRDICEDSLA